MAMTDIGRLSQADLNNLAIEAVDSQMHQMVLATLDREPLLDSRGSIRLAAVRDHVEARLARVPELRRIFYQPPWFCGRPIWIDDQSFHIENHVLAATLPPPGGDPAAMEFAAREMALLMERSQPLWRVWLLDGYSENRLGMLIKLHHALADGRAMVNILAQIFDLEPRACERPLDRFVAAPPPSGPELFRDNVRRWGEVVRRSAGTFRHPVLGLRATAGAVSASVEAIRSGRGAPRTSLNRRIGVSRRIAALHLPLEDVKEAAHRQGATLNDVFLCLAAEGMRHVLVARGEHVSGRAIRASVAVSLRPAAASMSGNHIGTVIVPIPADVQSPDELVAAVGAATARAKAKQLPVASTRLMVLLSRLGVTKAYIRRQHMINVLTTNLPGPPVPLYFAGARLYDPVALPPIAGNVTVSFAALSYDGGLTLSLVADRDSWPDLDVLVNGMNQAWSELQRRPVEIPGPQAAGAFGTVARADGALPVPAASGRF